MEEIVRGGRSALLVSVVIPHLRGEENLLNVLEDLRRETSHRRDVEVILVDNASSDGSTEAALERCPWIRVLRLSRNLGYAGGCNRGIRAARGSWVLLLNDDVRLDPGFLEEMLRVATSSPDIAAVQPKILSLREPEIFDYAGGAGGLMDRFGYPFALGRIGGALERDEGQYDTVREIFWASGTACLWRRGALRQTGLFDSAFFAHMEEIDLAWRAWDMGWRILSAPRAVVHHLGGGTLGYHSWRKMFLNHRNNLLTLAKNCRLRTLLTLLPARLALDNGIGLAELVSGRPARITAVWAGWLMFLVAAPRWLRQRKSSGVKRVFHDPSSFHLVYPGCILLEYLRGVRSALALASREK